MQPQVNKRNKRRGLQKGSLHVDFTLECSSQGRKKTVQQLVKDMIVAHKDHSEQHIVSTPTKLNKIVKITVKVSNANEFYNDFLLTTFVAFVQASSKLLNKLS